MTYHVIRSASDDRLPGERSSNERIGSQSRIRTCNPVVNSGESAGDKLLNLNRKPSTYLLGPVWNLPTRFMQRSCMQTAGICAASALCNCTYTFCRSWHSRWQSL